MACKGSNVLRLLDPSTLSIATIAQLPGSTVSAALDGDLCYVLDNAQDAGGARITVINLATATEVWRQTYKGVADEVFASGGLVALAIRRDDTDDSPADILRVDAENGAVLWRIDAGNRSPLFGVVMRNLLFVQVRQRDVTPKSTVTAALDIRDGRERLRFDHPFSCAWVMDAGNGVALASHFDYLAAIDTNRLWSISVGGAVRGTPLLATGSVLIGNASGQLTCAAADTGQTRWTRRLGGGIEGGAAALQGRVFIGHGAGVSAFEIATGQLVWSTATPQPVTGAILATAKAIVFGCRDNLIRAVSPIDGGALWSFVTQGFVEGGLAFDGELVFGGSADGHLYALSDSGQKVWEFTPAAAEIDEIKSTPFLADDLVIVGNASGYLYGIVAKTGELRWRRKLAGGIRTSTVLQHSDHIWIGDESGQVYHLLIEDGSIDWKVPVAGAVRGRPVWLAGELYVGTIAGTVDVLDIFTGDLKRRVVFGAPVFASPVIGMDAILVADEAGGVHALVPGP